MIVYFSAVTEKRSQLEGLIETHLPPYAFRIGYADEKENPFPQGLHSVRLDRAPANGLDSFFTRFRFDSENLIELTQILGLLRPGGVGFFAVSAKNRDSGRILKICNGTGCDLLCTETVRLLPDPEKLLLIALRKPFPKMGRGEMKQLSVLIPFGGDRSAEAVQAWRNYLVRIGMYERSEIIVVDDGSIRNEHIIEVEPRETRENILFLSHYKPFGKSEVMRTGILHTSGKYILVDESLQGIPPREFLPLLSSFLKLKHSSKNRSGVINGIRIGRMRLLKKGGLRRLRSRLVKGLTGSLWPAADFRLYDWQASREMIRTKSSDWTLESFLFFKKRKRDITDVIIEGVADSAPFPSLFRLLRLKLKWLFVTQNGLD